MPMPVSGQPEINPFARRILFLWACERVDSAIDEIINQVDDWLTAGDFASCDAFLADSHIEYPIVLSIAILSATLRAAPHLPARAGFVERAKAYYFAVDAPRAASLIKNLE